MRYSPQNVAAALAHLHAADPVMSALIRRVGPCRLRPRRDRFGMLVRSIVSQQISTKAAAAILRRVEALVAPEPPSAENLARVSIDRLRSAGLSSQKASYLHDLCEKVSTGRIELRRIGTRPDEEIIEQLVQVKGIGRWTAQMFLMFALGRLDVFPHDDLGVRVALRNLYGLDDLPDKATSAEIAAKWRPYCSVASWYCWRSLEAAPAPTTANA